jgi:hypothetical protein
MSKSAVFRTRVLSLVVLSLGFLGLVTGFNHWRAGDVVASAEFDPGIAPFDVRVLRVPVPVTGSEHFIVELRRGRYVVTSHRFFWQDYTPETVAIDWPCMNEFTVTFDDQHVATCTWDWGTGASWTMDSPQRESGLGEYYFTPHNEVKPECQPAPL